METNETKLAVARAKLSNLRDLSDFCAEWPDLKCLVSDEQLMRDDVSPETHDVVRLLVQFMDKSVYLTSSIYRDTGPDE